MNDLNFIKRAQTKTKVAELISSRWSPRSFSGQRIDDDVVESLFEAASWSASSSNLQPWVYVYSDQSSQLFHSLLGCLNAPNQVWAKDASLLVVSIANKKNASGKENRFAMHDLGMANATMLLQAQSHDIYGRMMGGYDLSRVTQLLSVPDDYEVASIIALGYLGDLEGKDQQFVEREMKPRSRKAVSEFAHTSSPFNPTI